MHVINNVLCCFVQEYSAYTKSHPAKDRAAGRPVVMLPLVLYSDDTSGNKSKQWNKFDSWCLKLAGLPNDDNQKLENIHFICTSNKVNTFTDSLSALVLKDVCVLRLTAFKWDGQSWKS